MPSHTRDAQTGAAGASENASENRSFLRPTFSVAMWGPTPGRSSNAKDDGGGEVGRVTVVSPLGMSMPPLGAGLVSSGDASDRVGGPLVVPVFCSSSNRDVSGRR